ncbi:prepilin peptidase [Siccirubricoccus sp. G192]|uniref:prepilin peptidase n=1 Tax=Siccirubricoccus sp. G192 TaxID=2849651 RepID=UPI001C2C97B3|nr:prepilin peptidase [Siccirubricoccus sp. G192]MBV1800150.1 prepilin peptidase [Siccirubricoccus sp. G192]
MLGVILGAAGAGSLLGGLADLAVRRLAGRPPQAWPYPAMACGAALAPLAALLLPAAAWPAATVFGALLLAIAWLDLRAGIVHAALAVPLALAGLGLAALAGAAVLAAALAGLALGYLGFLAVEWGFRRLRGREGLGRGDAWVLGAAGAWVGPGGLGLMVALAAALALGMVLLRDRRLAPDAAVPFAPALAASAWLVWIAGGGTASWVAP